MIKCERCGGQLTINNKGMLECPTCSTINRSVVLMRIELNALAYYKVLESKNILLPKIISEKDAEELTKKGIQVTIKGDTI